MKDFKYYETNYLDFLPKDKNAKILDFGCGAGYTLSFLQSKGYRNLYGADINYYETWAKLINSGVKIEQFDDTDAYIDSINGIYDFIIIKDVIYYFKDDEIINKIILLKSALTPSGKMLFDIINGSVSTGGYTQYKDFDIKLILTEHSLVTLIERGGMKLESIKGNIISVVGLGSILYLTANFIQKLRLKLLYFAERGFDNQNPKILSKKVIALASKE